MTELLVGTKKGLFVLRGDPSSGRPYEIVTRAFPGDVVEYAMRDARTGRYFAAHTSGFYGPRLMYTDDPTGEWTQAEGPAFPDDADASPERIWTIVPGRPTACSTRVWRRPPCSSPPTAEDRGRSTSHSGSIADRANGSRGRAASRSTRSVRGPETTDGWPWA